MKRFSTFFAVLMALMAQPLGGLAQEVALFDFQKNNLNLTIGTSVAEDGNLSGQDIVNGDVTMRATSGGTMHARYYYLASRGNQLQLIKDARLRFTAAEGKVITKVEFRLPVGSNGTSQINWKIDKGGGTLSTDMKTWEGCATSVRFMAGGPCYIDSIYVTTQAIVTPEADEYTEVASIAELNKLADGTLAKLTLNNAQVTANGIDGWTTYVQDETAAAHFYLIDQQLQPGDVLNGYMLVTKYTQTSNPRIGTSEDFSAETYTVTKGEATALEGSIAEVKTMDNINRLVKISGVQFDVESKTKGTATDSEGNSIVVFNGTSGMSPYAISGDLQSYASATITGILYNVSTGLQIYPLSIEKEPVIFDFTSETIRENIGTVLADTKGYIYNETFNVNGTTLQVTAGSAPSRIYVDANRGQNLVTYMQYTTLTFRAPEGYAITKIEFKAAGNSNINKLTPSSGEVEGMIWTGNADGVRFAQGGTSYLANAIVTLEAATEATAALPAIEYTECANIAAFNALEAGAYAKVTLTDAEIIGKSADGYSTVWIQDATGGAWIQYTSLNEGLAEQKKVSGTVYTVKRNDAGKDAHFKEAEGTPQSDLTIADLADYTVYSCATIAEANEHVNQLVKIEGATFTATGATAGTLTLGEETIKVNNGTATANQQLHKIADEWVKDETTMNNVTIIGINTIAYGILPISMEELVALPDGKQYATFSSTVDLDFTGTDIIAYTGVVSGNKVTLTPIKQVPAGTGVLLKGKVAGASANVPVAAGLSAVENNDFVAVTETIGSLTEGYILATVEGVQAFYMANGNKVEAGKAYLKAAEAGARINMVFADEATGISTMHNAQCTMHNAQCTMHNGQCTMHNEVYNLQGQRVGNAQCTMHNAQLKPGLYIQNGKKVAIK